MEDSSDQTSCLPLSPPGFFGSCASETRLGLVTRGSGPHITLELHGAGVKPEASILSWNLGAAITELGQAI